MTYGAGGSTREKTVELTKWIKQDLGIEAMAHLSCVGTTREELLAILDGIQASGIENVLALRGDPPRGETEWRPHPGGLHYSTELAALISGAYPFSIGAACFPEVHPEAVDMAHDLRFLKDKLANGVAFLITQLFFDNELYFHFLEEARAVGIEAPIIPGIMPITDVKQIKTITGMCGASIPAALLAQLERRSEDPEAVLQLGVAYSTLQCAELLARGAPGIHFYTLNRSPATRAILSALKLLRPVGGPPGRGGGRVVSKGIRTATVAALTIASLAGIGGSAQAQGTPALAKTQTIHSENWLHPPKVRVSGQDPDPGAGDLFLDAQNSIQAGPLILDPTGQLIWFKPMRRTGAFNVEVQSYQGNSVLTYWQGQVVPPGVGNGVDVILDHTYTTIATVHAGNGYHADLHEFQITPRGTALISAYAPVPANLQSVGGPPNGTVLDSVIQEINIAAGKVLWQWRAFTHVPLADSCVGVGAPFDYFHLNSIQQLPGDKLLVSARHTCAVYEIDKRTGKIVWQLGGKHSSFRMGRGTGFAWQHDAHLDGNTLTVFDNAAGPGPATERQSRALRVRLGFKTRRATLVRAYTNTPSVLSSNEGSVQTLPDGNTFVGWGGSPYFSEFGPGGQQLFSAHLPSPMQSYRAYRFPWWGQPVTTPSIAAASAPAGGTTVYASWNGATDVASWQVLAGPISSLLLPVGQFPKTSFESSMQVTSAGPYFQVQALGAGGQVLGTSATVELSGSSTARRGR